MDNKSALVNALLMCLREDIGREYFDITDHWESDPLAIGISKKGNPCVLVYINADEESKTFYAALELPSETSEYEDAGAKLNLPYDELLVIIRNHLGLENA